MTAGADIINCIQYQYRMNVRVHNYINRVFYGGDLMCMVADDGLFRVLWLSVNKCHTKYCSKMYSLTDAYSRYPYCVDMLEIDRLFWMLLTISDEHRPPTNLMIPGTNIVIWHTAKEAVEELDACGSYYNEFVISHSFKLFCPNKQYYYITN